MHKDHRKETLMRIRFLWRNSYWIITSMVGVIAIGVICLNEQKGIRYYSASAQLELQDTRSVVNSYLERPQLMTQEEVKRAIERWVINGSDKQKAVGKEVLTLNAYDKIAVTDKVINLSVCQSTEQSAKERLRELMDYISVYLQEQEQNKSKAVVKQLIAIRDSLTVLIEKEYNISKQNPNNLISKNRLKSTQLLFEQTQQSVDLENLRNTKLQFIRSEGSVESIQIGLSAFAKLKWLILFALGGLFIGINLVLGISLLAEITGSKRIRRLIKR